MRSVSTHHLENQIATVKQVMSEREKWGSTENRDVKVHHSEHFCTVFMTSSDRTLTGTGPGLGQVGPSSGPAAVQALSD